MNNNKNKNKNIPVSVSLTKNQKDYIDSHPKFNLSKFTQMILDDYINLANQIQNI